MGKFKAVTVLSPMKNRFSKKPEASLLLPSVRPPSRCPPLLHKLSGSVARSCSSGAAGWERAGSGDTFQANSCQRRDIFIHGSGRVTFRGKGEQCLVPQKSLLFVF